jgi:hypothetical protein
MPDHGVASWVSANDKPTTGAGSKPVSGDAAEQRLKTEVMQLPSRDRRRMKDLAQNDVGLPLGRISGLELMIFSSILKTHLQIYLGNTADQRCQNLQILFLRVLAV